jgi:hypothetical protein
MAGNNAAFVPLGSFNLDDLPDVALDDPASAATAGTHPRLCARAVCTASPH